MIKKSSVIILMFFVMFSSLVIEEANASKNSSKSKETPQSRLEKLRQRLSDGDTQENEKSDYSPQKNNPSQNKNSKDTKKEADTIREMGVIMDEMKERITRSDGFILLENYREKKRKRQNKEKKYKKYRLSKKDVEYKNKEKQSILAYNIATKYTEPEDISPVQQKIMENKSIKNYIPVELFIENLVVAIFQDKLNSVVAFSPEGVVRNFYPKEPFGILISVNYDSVDLILNLENENGDELILTGNTTYGFEGSLHIDDKKYSLALNNEGTGIIYSEWENNFKDFIYRDIKKSSGANVNELLSPDTSKIVTEKREEVLSDVEIQYNEDGVKQIDVFELVKEDQIPWPVNEISALKHLNVNEINFVLPVKANLDILKKGLYQKSVFELKAHLPYGVYDIYNINDFNDAGINIGANKTHIDIDVSNHRKRFVLFGNDEQGHKGFATSDEAYGINFIELNRKGEGYIYNLYPYREGRFEWSISSESNYVQSYKGHGSYKSSRTDNEDFKINYPDFWGEDPKLRKKASPEHHDKEREYVSRKITDVFMSEFKNKDISAKDLTPSKKNSYVIKSKKENDISLKDVSIERVEEKLEILGNNLEKYNSFKEKENFIKDFKQYINNGIDLKSTNSYINDLLSGSTFLKNKDFFKMYSKFLAAKRKGERFFYDSKFKVPDLNKVKEKIERLNKNFKKIIKSMKSVNILKKIPEKKVPLNLSNHLKKQMNKKNKESIYNCKRYGYFNYEYIEGVNEVPVALNANELIQNSNDFVKYKLPLNDKNKYFYLSSTSISYRYDCPRDEKEPCYKLIFTPLDNSYEDNITLYIDVESKKLIDSKVEINNDYNYRISLKKNKGYFYQVNIKNYNVVCDDILTNPEE